jgi:Flp pilus assembly secretin CpaC
VVGLFLLGASVVRADEPARRSVIESSHERMLVEKDIKRAAIGDTAILSFDLVSNREVLLLGKRPGQTTLMLWFADGSFEETLVNVHRDLSLLQSVLSDIYSGITVEGAPDRDAVVLRGSVPDVRFSRTAEAEAARYLSAANRGGARDAGGPLIRSPGVAATPAAGGAPTPEAGSTPEATTEPVRAPAQAVPTAAVINLIRLQNLPARPEDRILQAVAGMNIRTVKVRRVVKGQVPDDALDVFVLEGQIPDQIALVRVLTLAAGIVSNQGQGALAQNDIRVVADEAGGVNSVGGAAPGGQTGGSTAGGSSLGLGGGGNLSNLISKNVGRAKILSAARGRVLSFLEVKDLPQVRVAVQFYEVNRTKARTFNIDLGIPGSNGLQPGLGPLLPAATYASGVANPGAFAQSLGPQGVNPVDVKNVFSFLNSGMGNEIQVVGKKFAVNAAFQFLESEHLARNLSAPTLTVLSGERADFTVGGALPITSSFAQAGVGISSTVSFIQFGVELSIRPLVGEDDEITLDITPQVITPNISLTQQVTQATGTNQGSVGFNTRSLQTSARLQDGQSLLIGGLMTSDTSNDAQFAPFLNKIPVVEWLFKKTQASDDELELVIVLNPTIVRDPNRSGMLWEYPSLPELMRSSTGPKAPH